MANVIKADMMAKGKKFAIVISRFNEFISSKLLDGCIDALVPWFMELGVEGFLPIERRAGNDAVSLRKRHPRLKMIGGFDKNVISLGEPEVRSEFERLLPAMQQGGYIPALDHQTPPDVSLENYKIYIHVLREYSSNAVS